MKFLNLMYQKGEGKWIYEYFYIFLEFAFNHEYINKDDYLRMINDFDSKVISDYNANKPFSYETYANLIIHRTSFGQEQYLILKELADKGIVSAQNSLIKNFLGYKRYPYEQLIVTNEERFEQVKKWLILEITKPKNV